MQPLPLRLLLALLALLTLGLGLPVRAQDKDLDPLFQNRGIEGSLVLASLDGQQHYIHDDQRAKTLYAPASTFKILNTLIALDEGAIAGPEGMFHWDGTQYEIPDWNRDQTLAQAFRASCVWCYQELARRIGPVKYRQHLRDAAYGHLHQVFDTTAFWLQGDLQITPLEQVDFLTRLHRRQLPYSSQSQDALRAMMLQDDTRAYRLYAKTGWAARTTPQAGWYVGYVETPKGVWLFATLVEMRSAADLSLRRQITLEALRAKGIIP